MTLRVYTDVTGMQPKTRLGGLLKEGQWALMGTETEFQDSEADDQAPSQPPKTAANVEGTRSGSDGTRTRGLRRDRPAL